MGLVRTTLFLSFLLHFALLCPLFPLNERVLYGNRAHGEMISFELKTDGVRGSKAIRPALVDKKQASQKPAEVVSTHDQQNSKTSSQNDEVQAGNGLGDGTVEGNGIPITVEPRVLFEPKSKKRTDEARKAGYTGVAKLVILIGIDGKVKKARLLNSLEYGLNERALDLAKQLIFSPAMAGDKPVAVEKELNVSFRSQD